MTKVFTDLAVFLKACGQDYPAIPSEPNALAELYLKLIKEEYHEFLEAIEDANDAEQLDACFDMILDDAPWPATKDELIDYAIRSGAPLEVIENLQELEDDGEPYESIEEIWSDYPSDDDYFFNEDEF